MHWRDHLAAMDYLRQGIHLRGYAQQDYRYEYKREAFQLFSAMLDRVKFDTVSRLATAEVRTQEQIDQEEAERRERLMRALQAQHAEVASVLGGGEIAMGAESAPAGPQVGPGSAVFGSAALTGAPAAGRTAPGFMIRPRPPAASAPAADGTASGAAGAPTFVRDGRKVGRNEPCPCGSGKKYKHCHGALASSQ
jgi:preprotein translocase subunit SecA